MGSKFKPIKTKKSMDVVKEITSPQAPGRIPAKVLFKEYYDAENYPHVTPIYSLEEFHKVFLDEMDITEYKPAIKLVGSWQEWCRLKGSFPTFNQYLTLWKEEVEIKLTSIAMAKLNNLLTGEETPDSQRLAAAKWIAENNWNKKEKGRPSSKQKEHEAKELARAAAETKEEESRILRVINGGMVKNG